MDDLFAPNPKRTLLDQAISPFEPRNLSLDDYAPDNAGPVKMPVYADPGSAVSDTSALQEQFRIQDILRNAGGGGSRDGGYQRPRPGYNGDAFSSVRRFYDRKRAAVIAHGGSGADIARLDARLELRTRRGAPTVYGSSTPVAPVSFPATGGHSGMVGSGEPVRFVNSPSGWEAGGPDWHRF